MSAIKLVDKVSAYLSFFLFFNAFIANGQVSSVSPGSWDNPNNWSPVGVPNPSSATIIVNHEMTITGDRSWSVWSGTRSVTVNTGGKIEISGNLILQGGSTNFIINGGEIEVSGILTIQNGGAELTVQSGILDAGTLQVNYGSTVLVGSGSSAEIGTLNVGNSNTALFQNNGSTIVTGDVNFNGSLINNGSLLATNITGLGSGSSVFDNSGQIDVSQNISLPSSSKFNALQGSTTIVDGSVTVTSNDNIRIGDSNAPPAYTDMLIKGDLTSTGSGDIVVNSNGRLAVYGDITASAGGSFLRLENGGQTYVQGSIDFSGGTGNTIDNRNTELGFIGLYIDGNVTFSEFDGFVGGESLGTQSSGNSGYNSSDDLPGENDDFATWLGTLEDSPFLSPLPIELKTFDVWSEGQIVRITWVTATEDNNDFFEIERSSDGRNFDQIARIDGAGNSTDELTYSFEDTPPRNEWWYYRLKQTDFDGQFEIFEMKVVEYQGLSQKISVYPNPATNFIKWSSLGIIDAQLVALDGEVVVRKYSEEAFNELPLNVESAIYILRLTRRNGQVTTQRIIKR